MISPSQDHRGQRGDFSRLIRYLMQLARERAFAKVEITYKAGQITVIHVDRPYGLNDLPIRGEGTPQP